LTKIYRHIARDNPKAASRMLLALYAACDGLALFPRRGRRIARPDTRELMTARPYVIQYKFTPRDGVEIAAIWHGAQDRRH